MIDPVADALPHGPAMRLVVNIKTLGEDRITCCCRIPRDFPWVGAGSLPAYVAMEGVAQAAGLLVARPARGSPHGYVVRIREADFSRTGLNPLATWTVTTELAGRSGQIVLCRGEAWQAGVRLLRARFALYLEGFGQSR